MLFSSFTFVFVFLPIVLLLYYLCRSTTARNSVLLGASIVFYGWGEPRYLSVLLVSVFATWVIGIVLSRVRCRRLCLTAGILVLLGILMYFKYMNFLLENLNLFLHHEVDFIHVVLPVGISFYTFQAISYLVDVYRGEVPAQRSLYKLTLYITLFPQLVAGPIVKYHDVCEQIDSRKESAELFICGTRRFIFGLAKKMLIANTLGSVADAVFAQSTAQTDIATAWMGIVAYSIQLYYDFSGYSDMAIGLCLMFGFRIPENFNYPYISRSITELWRRWHISLTTWFRLYLYFPLGGNRVSPLRHNFNLFMVFLVTGIWHGAGWTFFLWGMWNGILVMLEKLVSWDKREGGICFEAFRHVLTLAAFLIGMVLFRSDTVMYACEYIQNLIGCGSRGLALNDACPNPMTGYAWLMFLIGSVMATPIARDWYRVQGKAASLCVNLWCLCLFLASAATMAASTYNPFIYFRF